MDNWYIDNDEAYGDLQDEKESVLLLALAKQIEEEEARPAIINPVGMARIMEAYRILADSMEELGAEVTYELHEPLKSFGSINITSSDYIITNTEEFGRAVLLASNCEVYARTDGNICISLGFHGLTKPIVYKE